MEVFDVLNDLEELVEESTRIPMTSKVLVDADELLDYLDRIRAILPDELKQAKWIAKEHQRILQDAEAEAQKRLADATEQSGKLAEQSEVVRQAEGQAQEIVQKAQVVAKEIHLGAKGYADDILVAVESNLERIINEVRKSRQELNQVSSERKQG